MTLDLLENTYLATGVLVIQVLLIMRLTFFPPGKVISQLNGCGLVSLGLLNAYADGLIIDLLQELEYMYGNWCVGDSTNTNCFIDLIVLFLHQS